MLCSLSFTDLLWGATVASVDSSFRIKHLMNSQVCEVYSEMMAIPLFAPTAMSLAGTFSHLFIMLCPVQVPGDPVPRPRCLFCSLGDVRYHWHS